MPIKRLALFIRFSPPRRGFFILQVLTAVLCQPQSNLRAALPPQTITTPGRILDSLDQPIPFTAIHNLNLRMWTLSDDDGYFRIPIRSSASDTLLVERIGYRPQRFLARPEDDFLLLSLMAHAITLAPLEVTGARHQHAASVSMRADHPPEQGHSDHHSILRQLPGLTLRSYGGPAGISNLSIDGGPASHTRVLLDGFELTNAQNGETDLSQLPTPMIQEVEYLPFEPQSLGSGSLDGTVRLLPRTQTNGIGVSFGSYGHQSVSGSAALARDGFRGSLFGGIRRDEGNYPVEWRERAFIRQNNDFFQVFAGFQGQILLTPEVAFRWLVLNSEQDRGVAGQVWSPNTLSRRDDRLLLAGGQLAWQSRFGSGRGQFVFRLNEDHFDDAIHARRSDHELSTWQGRLDQAFRLHHSLDLYTGLHLQRESVISSELNPDPRSRVGFQLQPRWRPRETIQVQVELDAEIQRSRHPLFDQCLSLSINPQWPLLGRFTIHTASRVRLPTFNDLYWIPGGNPDLKAETARVLTLNSSHPYARNGNLQLQFQVKESENLIQWMPSQSYWQPTNIDSASRTSMKVTWQQDLPALHLELFAHVTHARSRYQVSGPHYDKALRYAPLWTGNLGIRWTPAASILRLEGHYIDERIAMYSYPLDAILPAVWTWTAAFGQTLDLKPMTFTLSLVCDNLLDIHYDTILGYPEPGRTWRLTLQTSIH